MNENHKSKIRRACGHYETITNRLVHHACMGVWENKDMKNSKDLLWPIIGFGLIFVWCALVVWQLKMWF